MRQIGYIEAAFCDWSGDFKYQLVTFMGATYDIKPTPELVTTTLHIVNEHGTVPVIFGLDNGLAVDIALF